MEIGSRIRRARREIHLTQKDFAVAIGKSYSTVQKYELNLAVPPLDVLSKISEFTGFSLDYLTGKSEIQRGSEKITGDSTADEYGTRFAQIVTDAWHRAEIRGSQFSPERGDYTLFVYQFAEQSLKRLEEDLRFLIPEVSEAEEQAFIKQESTWDEE